MTDFLKTAENIARQAHAGQFRRDGVTPCITHPEAIVARLKAKGGTDEELATAWLHDVLEDAKEPLDFRGLPSCVVTAVCLLTKRVYEEYDSYLATLKSNELARKVKIQDILHNLSDGPTKAQVLKYCKALTFLLT